MPVPPPDAEWIRFARIDLESAEILADHGGHADTTCFLAQQCVEKVLKAFISRSGHLPPKIHDLVALHRRAGSPDLGAPEGDVAWLSDCYLRSRYPTLQPETRTSDDAERALRVARAAFTRAGGGAVR